MYYLKKSLSFIFIALAIFIINTSAIFADEQVNVYINSSLIKFDDAQPQIINSRVMVPIRTISEALGAEVDWNSTTETMTLTKGSLTVVHTINSNIITVNGTAITFDTPSTIINSRTLVPVRMIAEALNCNVEWDNDTRSVYITVDEAYINSVVTDSTSIYDGEKLTITVNASENTERIKVVDTSNDEILVESYTYTTLSNGSKVFSIPWIPQEGVSSVKTLKVFAGSLLSYNESPDASKSFSIIISGSSIPTITKVEVSNDTVARNEYVTLTIYANSLTSRIKISDDLGENLTEVTNYTLSGSTRIFETKVKMTSRGSRQLYIYPGNSSNYEDAYMTVDITVTGTVSSSSDKLTATLTIHDITTTSDTVYVDEEATAKIYTSSDISRIEIQNSDGNVIQKINFPYSKDTSNNEYIWYADIPISSSGKNKFYVVAYDEDEKSTKESLTITGETYSTNDLVIVNVTQKTSDAMIGDKVTFSVKTTSPVSYIEVREGSTVVQTLTSYSSSGSFKTFTFKIELTSYNVNNLRVVAYSQDGLNVSQRIYPDYTEYIEPEIYEVEVKNSSISLNEYIRISVYTNSAVSKVWVEDSNDVRVVVSTQYSDVSGDEYVWDIKFPAEEIGSRVLYTVYVQSDDNLIDEYSFRVKVTS